MKLLMYDLYVHWGIWLSFIFLSVQMAVDPEAIGEIRANVNNLCEQMRKLTDSFAEVAKNYATQNTAIAVLLERVHQHDDRLDAHEEKIEAVVATVGKIEAVVFPKSRGSAAQGNPVLAVPAEEDDQGRVSMPRWLILLIIVISAIAGDVLLQYVAPALFKP